MANALSGEVRSLLFDVMYSGAAIVHKRKLLRLLGWVNDKQSAWSDLLDHWIEIGGECENLCADEVLDKIVLSLKSPRGQSGNHSMGGVSASSPTPNMRPRV
jgi:hypothetical protein